MEKISGFIYTSTYLASWISKAWYLSSIRSYFKYMCISNSMKLDTLCPNIQSVLRKKYDGITKYDYLKPNAELVQTPLVLPLKLSG